MMTIFASLQQPKPDRRQTQFDNFSPLDGVWNVQVISFKSTKNVFVKPIGDNFDKKYEQMLNEMNAFYVKVPYTEMVELCVGEMYAAFVNGNWIRAKMVSLNAGESNDITFWFRLLPFTEINTSAKSLTFFSYKRW